MAVRSHKWDEEEKLKTLEIAYGEMKKEKGSNAAIDMLEGLAGLIRSPKQWEAFFTVEGPDGKPILLRWEEA